MTIAAVSYFQPYSKIFPVLTSELNREQMFHKTPALLIQRQNDLLFIIKILSIMSISAPILPPLHLPSCICSLAWYTDVSSFHCKTISLVKPQAWNAAVIKSINKHLKNGTFTSSATGEESK